MENPQLGATLYRELRDVNYDLSKSHPLLSSIIIPQGMGNVANAGLNKFLTPYKSYLPYLDKVPDKALPVVFGMLGTYNNARQSGNWGDFYKQMSPYVLPALALGALPAMRLAYGRHPLMALG